MSRHASLAEQYRHHAKVFRLALEMGCTPREAEAEMRRIEARERARAARDRLDAKLNMPLRPGMAEIDAAERESAPDYWWKRD